MVAVATVTSVDDSATTARGRFSFLVDTLEVEVERGWSSEALTAAELERLAADLPMLVAPNAAEQFNNAAEWRAAGSWSAGSDITAASSVLTWSTSRVHDRLGDLVSKPSTASATTYLIFDLADVTFDTIAIIGHNFDDIGVTEVAVEIATTDDFITGFQEVAIWYGGATRYVSTDLDGLRYRDVQYLRIRIESAGVIAPKIGEFFLGTRYTVPHRQDAEADDLSLEGRADVFEAEGGQQQRITRWGGRLATALTWRPDTTEYVNTFRDWFAATRWGADPFLWIPHPLTIPHAAYYCRTEARGMIVNDVAAANTRTVPLIEQAPFVSSEA